MSRGTGSQEVPNHRPRSRAVTRTRPAGGPPKGKDQRANPLPRVSKLFCFLNTNSTHQPAILTPVHRITNPLRHPRNPRSPTAHSPQSSRTHTAPPKNEPQAPAWRSRAHHETLQTTTDGPRIQLTTPNSTSTPSGCAGSSATRHSSSPSVPSRPQRSEGSPHRD